MDKELYVEHHKGTGDKIIVTFNGRDPNYTGDKPLEWANLLKDHYKHLIAFHDTEWKWYISDNCKDTITRELEPFDTVDLGLGLSMGGWGVLYHQDLLKTNRIRAFGAQSRVNVEWWNSIGPRHAEWAEKIDPSADIMIKEYDGKDIKLAFGLEPEDNGHFDNFVKLGYSPIRVKTKSHRAVNRFKRDGTLMSYLFD